MVILKFALILILVTFVGLIYMGIARKVIARIQNRYGPPFYQPILDVLKLLGKKGNMATHGVMHALGPVIALTGIATTLMFLPLGKSTPLFSFNGDLFVVLYLLVVAPLGMALGSTEASNPNASIGIARGLSLMLGYEFIFFLSVLPVFYHFKTTSILKIVQMQSALPKWNLFPYALSAIGALFALQGMLGEKPFDQIIAPHEIASGPMVEYGGKYLGILQLYHAIGIIVETGLFVDIFLGATTIWWFFAGTFIMFMIAIIIETVMPRFRVEQVIKFYWKLPLAFAVLGVIQVLIWR